MTDYKLVRVEPTADMADLIKRLRIKAGMIELGEIIAWGSDSALMREAADVLERSGSTPAVHRDVSALVELLDHARCNTCDGSGALYDGHGQAHQCQWCRDRSAAIAAHIKGTE